MLRALNYLLHIVHVAVILFVLSGWMITPLRLYHLILCGLVLTSWFAIGIPIKKPGFCLITDIQYRIRSRLGIQDKPQSYMVFLWERVIRSTVDEYWLDVATQAGLYIPTILSAVLLFS